MKKKNLNPTVGIIGGRGILGTVFRAAFQRAGFDVLISGRKPDGKKILSNRALVKKSDIVIVSVFLRDTEKVLREITPLMRKNQLLCDFTSVKELPLEIMKTAKSEVVGLHPMFGSVKDLNGKNIFACKVRSGTLWKQLKKSLKDFGLNIHEVSAKKHDELAALHQASTHLLFLAFARLLRKKKISPQKLFDIASPSTQNLLLTTGRILTHDLEMYTDIQLLNPQTKKTAVELAQILIDLDNQIVHEKRADLLKSFQQASRFFGKWSTFAESESNKIFDSISPQRKILSPVPCPLSPANSIGVFGSNTQTEIAAREFLQKNKLKNPIASFTTISEIFENVLKNKIEIGFIPLENFSIGPVRETMRSLFEARGKIKIFASSERRIQHSLLGTAKIPLKKVSTVCAHPQALAQCAKFLQKNLPHAEIIETANAGTAIEKAQQDSSTLAISSAEFAKNAGLKVIKQGIEDSKENKTRFIAIRKSSSSQKPRLRQGFGGQAATSNSTALAFFFSQNKAGQLAAALDIFAKHKINLSRIESIPTEKKQGEFFFFTECEKSKHLPKALKELGKVASVVELGSY